MEETRKVVEINNEIMENYGPWMLVSNKPRRDFRHALKILLHERKVALHEDHVVKKGTFFVLETLKDSVDQQNVNGVNS